jgi:flagella basal body P-ring formation protein FlgA
MKSTRFSYRQYRLYTVYVIGLLALLLPATTCNILASELTRVQILEKVQIAGEKILLGDIANITGGDSQLIKKLSAIMVGRAPLPGNSRRIDRGTINIRLKQNRIDPAELVLDMPASINVSRSCVKVGPEKIKEMVSDYITKNILSGNPDARIKNIQVSENLSLPIGSVTYEVTAPRNRDLVGQVPFAVNFNVNGKLYKRVWANVTIEVLAEVVITRKPLGRHKPITEDDIMVLRMDLSKVPSDVITDPEAVLGKRTRRAIGSKTVMRANLVEFPPLVRRGDVVVIVAETNGFKITALGQVKKKGALGDRIPVMNFDSKKVLYARVMDANTVKIDF